MTVRLSPVPVLRNAICAFCSTARVGSVTVPVNAPVDADWAHTSKELTTTMRQMDMAWRRKTVAAEHTVVRKLRARITQGTKQSLDPT